MEPQPSGNKVSPFITAAARAPSALVATSPAGSRSFIASRQASAFTASASHLANPSITNKKQTPDAAAAAAILSNYSQKVINQLLLAPEGKREEFRLYLEQTQIMDALSRFFVNLYDEIEKETPENVVRYFLQNLSTVVPLKSKVDSLNSDVDRLHRRFADLEQENQRLRQHLQMYEPTFPHEELGEGYEEGQGQGPDKTFENKRRPTAIER